MDDGRPAPRRRRRNATGTRIDRRAFLIGGLAAAVGACSNDGRDLAPPSQVGPTADPAVGAPASASAPPLALHAGPAVAPVLAPPDPGFVDDPFRCGVASGDPLPDAFMVWTRLHSQLADGVTITEDLAVALDVGTDPTFATVVVSETVAAPAAAAHTARFDATGLSPTVTYWYRFRVGSWSSPIGRARTTPAAGDYGTPLRIAAASCQDWEAGTYVAYDHLAADEPDLVLWLGDYIYTGGAVDGRIRRHPDAAAVSLDQYRERYAFYRSDPKLQSAHAICPWIVTWDDHEVENNYAGLVSSSGELFAEKRAAAYRAWWEHMPVRLPPPEGPDLPMHREFRWGGLASLVVLDGRQHRTDQACGDGAGDSCAERLDADRTMLGAAQEAWLAERFRAATDEGITWTVLANQTMLADLTVELGARVLAAHDQWDGYPAARDRLYGSVVDSGVENLVVLTGDLHASVVSDLTFGGRTLGSEFVVTAISSAFTDGRAAVLDAAPLLVPDLLFTDTTARGYVLATIDADQFRGDYRWMTAVDADASTVNPDAPSWRIDAGTAGVRRA